MGKFFPQVAGSVTVSSTATTRTPGFRASALRLPMFTSSAARPAATRATTTRSPPKRTFLLSAEGFSFGLMSSPRVSAQVAHGLVATDAGDPLSAHGGDEV